MRKTILVIEDDTEVQRVYEAVLADLANIRLTSSMEQAREKLQGVDLILLDYYLRGDPVSFGKTVDELKPVAPILVCSGVPAAHLRHEVQQHGLAGYWSKGSGLETLHKKVSELLEKD